ncbi:hypothetical protein J6590_006037 [Homalodisca vitripennis]|nr:hypothetical protein J6590_006037 [Homalodisca vitripennis]
MTLISSFNRRNKKAGLFLQRNGKTLNIELSAIVESKLIELKGTVTNGEDEFSISLGAQKGTKDESSSAYIHAFKNQKSIFWLSLEGSDNLQKTAGLKFSFSSLYHHQRYFQITSNKEESKHTFLVSYLHGADFTYSLNMTIVKIIAMPQLAFSLQLGPHVSSFEARYDAMSAKKTVAIKFEQNKENIIGIEGEISISKQTSKVEFNIVNKNLLGALKSMKILGEYNFDQESFVMTTLMVNDVKYFNLLLRSNSLYDVQFLSSLVSSNYINTPFDITLIYRLALPNSGIFSVVKMNGDYYKCIANLTWTDISAQTFFHLNTSGGYGFENAVLSAKYSVDKHAKYSHLINFFVDDSTLFHVSSDISYPSQMSFDLILPDSLFLPFVKQIKVGFNFTEEAKTILFKYLSKSDEKRIIFSLLLQNNYCDINIGRSEMNDEEILQSDKFKFSYSIQRDLAVYLSSLSWENNNVFSISYVWEDSPNVVKNKHSLPTILFNSQNTHVLNITAALGSSSHKPLEFVGVLSPFELLFHLKHPTITKTGLSELDYTRTLGDKTYMKVYYKNSELTEMGIKYTDVIDEMIDFFANSNGKKSIIFTNLTLRMHDNVFSLVQQDECEDLITAGVFNLCSKMKHQSKWIGLTKKQQSLDYSLDLIDKEVLGAISTASENYKFSGKFTKHSIFDSHLCSNISFNLYADHELKSPFDLKYENNCENNLYASLKIFEENPHDIRVVTDIIANKLNGIKVQGKNFPFIGDWFFMGKKSDHVKVFEITMKKGWFSIEWHNTSNKHRLTIKSSLDEFKMLEITRSMNEENRKRLGTLKYIGLKSCEWGYTVVNYKDGSIFCHITSDQNIQVNITLNVNNKKELIVKILKNEKQYEGKGLYQAIPNGDKIIGEGYFTFDGKLYSLNFERLVRPEEHKSLVEVKTPADDYYVELYINKLPQNIDPAVIVKYKTPFYPLDYADIKVWFNHYTANSNDEFSLLELDLTHEKVELYNKMFKVVSLSTSVKTHSINIDKAQLDISYGGKYGINLSHLTKQILLELYPYENKLSHALQSTFKVSGFNMPGFHHMGGEILFRAYVNKIKDNAFAYLRYHIDRSLTFVMKKEVTKENQYSVSHKFGELQFNNKTVLKINLTSSNDSHYYGNVHGEWEGETLLLDYNVQEQDLKFQMKLTRKNKPGIDTTFYYYRKISTNSWIRSFQLNAIELFSLQDFNPKIVITKEMNKLSIVKYELQFNNGVLADNLFFSGNCSISYPNLESFSVNSNPKLHADILLESVSRQYVAIADLIMQRNKMDAMVKWKRITKSVTYKQNKEYMTLKFGGLIMNRSAEFYLNENKFSGFIDSSSTQSVVSAHLFNDKLKKNMTVFASVQYSPIYLLTISHTVFDSPCSVEVKVDRRPQSLETAVTIIYNHLTQQAFVNIYLDSNPRYAELMYLDIWQQTHEASVYVEEKDNEVTVRGKINSPAIDENFLIVTVGLNSDKFEMNMNDDFIFKAFKDNTSGLLHLIIFGNNYQMQCSHENEVKLSLVSPNANGIVTISSKELKGSFASFLFESELYHFLLEVNKNNILTMALSKGEKNIFDVKLDILNGDEVFQLQFQCNMFAERNGLNIKHVRNPILLVVSLTSSQFLKHNLDIMLGMKKEDLVTGIFEIKQNSTLFKSYIGLCRKNNSLEINIEAPLFSKMDKAKINGVFNVFHLHAIELNFSAALSSEDIQLYKASFYLTKDDKITSGLVVKSKDQEDIQIMVLLPLRYFADYKFVLQLPSIDYYEFAINFFDASITNDNTILSLLFRREDFIVKINFKHGDNPFYSKLDEVDVQYSASRLRIGAWMAPTDPRNDYKYFVEWNGKHMLQISHACVLQTSHFRSKFTIETSLKGHEKYGIDLELQNQQFGKVVKVIGSAPQLGNDLGVDFGFHYDSLLNYAILAQIRIPYECQVKMLRIYSLHKIHPNLNIGKLNYTFEFTDLGVIGLEIELHESAPFMWQGKMFAVESKLNLNNKTFLLRAKSFLQANKIQLVFGLETPLKGFKKGEVHFSGTRQIVGSEFVLSLNSNELINVNITEDATNKKELKILSKWRNLVFNYKYKVGEEVDIYGYFCWDLLNRNTSQVGVVINAAKNNRKYKCVVDLLLPSLLVPKLSLKSNFEHNINRVFSLVQLDLPGLLLEGKLASEISTSMYNSGVQLRWATTSDKVPKNIGVFYVKEMNEDEIKHYFTLQHFSLPNDLILTTYARTTLYGINLRYSPVKEEEITLEFGYWMNEDNKQERSGVRFVVIHQATNTLVFGVANVTTASDITEGGLSVAYLTDQDVNKAKYLAVYGKKNKKTPGIYLGLTSNGNSIGLGGSLWTKDNHLTGLTIETKVNQKDPFKLEMVLNVADPSIETELSYSLSRRYRFFAGIPNDNEITAKLSHTMYGKPSLDAFASLRLNTSRILWGRFELPPMTQVGPEFYNGVLEEYSDITLVSQAVLSGFSDFLQEDFSKKIALFFDAISNEADVIVSQTYMEMELVVKSVEVMGDIAQQLYDEDHFYLQTCFQYLKHSAFSIYSYMSCAFEVIFDVAKNVFGPLFEIAQRVWVVMESVLVQWRTFIREAGIERKDVSNVGGESPVKHLSKLIDNYQHFRHSLMDYARQAVATAQVQLTQLEQRSVDILTEAELAVNHLIRDVQHTLGLYLQRAINYKDTILAGFSVLRDTVQGMIEIVTDGIYQIEEVRYGLDRLVRCLEVVDYWYRDFQLKTYLREIDAYIDRIVHLITSDIERNFGEYEVYLVHVKHLLEGQYEEVSKIPQVHYMKNAIIQVYEKIKWFWNYAKLSERLRDAMKQYFENMKANLDELEKQLDRDEGELRSEYVYNAENNSLTFTQELPFEWRGFNQLPDYKTEMNSNPLSFPAQEYSNMVHTMANYLWQDAKLLPYLLPPFGSDAIISGDSYITFDNTFYLFRGGCGSYLLASDLYHNSFSLLANYDEQNKRDILLITGELEILVKNNLEVHVNGKLEDLPLVLNSGKQLTLERKVHSVLIKSREGFSLECSSFQDMCKFHLDGWYMGKTAGLLGTYNHEPSDDFVSPDRQPSGNIREFIDSWSIEAKQCGTETDWDLSTSVGDSRHYEMCEMFFSSQSSPFFPCFHVVDPKSFSEMCLSTASHDSTCSAVMAYLTKCTSAGVQLWMPEFCVDSSISNSSRESEYPDFIEVPAKMSADVVFIMEEADCLSSDKLNFGVLLANLNSDLNAKGLTDNKFALISFNSKNVQIHTINGEVWTGDEKRLVAAVNRIESSEGQSLYTSALQFAADLPYRPGATKAAVLVHCSDCPHTENYGALLERFSRTDITLHVLQRAHLAGRKGKGVSKVIGLEKSGAYPRKRLFRNASPDPQLLHQVSAPQDLCTPLVLGTNGTLFEMDVSRKGGRVWSGRVADGASQLSDWQQCENSVGEDNVPMWRCRRSHSHRLKDWDMIALHEYMDTSHGEDVYPEYGDEER